VAATRRAVRPPAVEDMKRPQVDDRKVVVRQPPTELLGSDESSTGGDETRHSRTLEVFLYKVK